MSSQRYTLTPENLLEDWGAFLHYFARKLTGNAEDAEDLVSETIIKVLRNLHRFDGRMPKAWLSTVMKNTFINNYRRLQRQNPRLAVYRSTLPVFYNDPRLNDFLEPPIPEEVLKAIENLVPEFRTTFKLRHFEGRKYREIAVMTGVPLGTVMSRLHRATYILRKVLNVEHQSR